MSVKQIISAAIVTVVAISAIVGWVNLSHRRDMFAARQTEVVLLRNATLIEIYMRRHGRALRPPRGQTLGGSDEIDTVQTEARELLLPFGLEVADGWGTRIQYCVSGDLQEYAMVSAGADGKLEQPCRWDYPHRHTDDWDADIILHSGHLSQWEGGWCCNPQLRALDLQRLVHEARTKDLGRGITHVPNAPCPAETRQRHDAAGAPP